MYETLYIIFKKNVLTSYANKYNNILYQ